MDTANNLPRNPEKKNSGLGLAIPPALFLVIFFIAPLLMTLLAGPVLGERSASAHRWALATGMVGVLVALRPGGDGLVSWAGLAVLGSAVCYAASAVFGRLCSRTDSSESLMLWLMLFVRPEVVLLVIWSLLLYY